MKRTCLAWGLMGAGFCSLGLAQGCGGDAKDEFKAAPPDEMGGAGGSPPVVSEAGGEGGGPTGSIVQQPPGGAGGEAPEPMLAGAGGEGGGGPTCSDQDVDQDGQSECDLDCDDQNPLNFVGNREICGDLSDNNCDSVADEAAICGGIGTFVSELTGNDTTGTGTTDNPVKTIAKGIQNAQAILQTAAGALTAIDVYVAEGTYLENVTLVEGIDLLGGFSCTAQPCSWARDPSANVSSIVNQRFPGVLADQTITRETRFDGFDVSGLDGNATGNLAGTVGITLAGGTPPITTNTIAAGDNTGGNYADGRSVGIAILAPSNDTQGALIDSNTITGGSSLKAASIGLMMDSTSGSPGRTYAVVTRNTIQGGSGMSSFGITSWNSGTGTVFRNNDIFGGVAKDGANGTSFGVAGSGVFLLDANRINVNPPLAPSCAAAAQWCGGVRSISATATIVNNVIFGIPSTLSAGVVLNELETPAGVVVLNSNYIDGGGAANSAGTTSAAVSMSIGGCCGNQTWVGRIMNNVLAGGISASRFGVYEQATPTRQAHPEALRHNAFLVPTLGAPDALYRFYNGSAGTLHKTIADVNALAAVIGPVGGNIDTDCLVDPATFELPAGSPCLDQGTATDAPAFDSQGDARPAGMGFDIGADEAG